ncbi:MAG: helix-turn-helix domain-containing protein [Treponema sp.]|nr:helix-turn-helix domain-containing protein [Treponema sp.]MCL2272907.1 helix-turn-helix domain-containing protein [Treponema sp.]
MGIKMTEQELRAVFGGNLKRYRNYRKLSQAKLAENLGISIPFLSDIENGRKWVSPATLVKFSDFLGIEPHELFKPTRISAAMENNLEKWGTDVIQAVTQTVSDIQKHYVIEPENR